MLKIAHEFAALIDAAKFDDAAKFLAEDCTYHYYEGNYAGGENIVNIDRMHHKMGQENFDEIRYSSEAREMPDGKFKIQFNDLLRMGERWHASHNEEILTIEDGLIRHIEHLVQPAEMQAFVQFMQEVRAG
jgi:hypothetical protein